MDSTLAKGLAVLDWLARQPKGARVSDVAAAFGLARSNAHRTLRTLVGCGFAQQDEATSVYGASLRLFELGTLVGAATDVQARLRPRLQALAESSGETIHLARLDGADIVYLDKFDSPLPVAAYSRIGGRAPACCVASGKALLAAVPPDAGDAARGASAACTRTPRTASSTSTGSPPSSSRTAARGYAENREEWRLGVCGLGAPVFDARGEPVAAVGMSVPSIRFAAHAGRARSPRSCWPCARDASAALGFRQPIRAAPHRAARAPPPLNGDNPETA